MGKKEKSKKKGKRKLTPAEKREKKRRQAMYETIFVNGKQKRVLRSPPGIDYSQIDDPIFFAQNEMWEELHAWEQRRDAALDLNCDEADGGIPF
ncbi:hypothetical protein [Pontiella sulfatireligans]|uniref:Uncharacterized protein n=1 Tax=Pontiella sulfatireligans TaxID=2750658 RepID=A0A6C2URJ6_9BACT|nr:hypothetical protein [Pontiella sulfatireligans]VGO22573.1 hypothetical protein SCARR_04658 [Pontiella sulfatireligans]